MKESAVQKGIMDLLAAERTYALRINTGAGWANGKPIQHHSGGAGVADILAFPRFGDVVHVLWIEVKGPAGKQTLEQRSFQEHVEELGMNYLLARSSDDVLEWLREHK